MNRSLHLQPFHTARIKPAHALFCFTALAPFFVSAFAACSDPVAPGSTTDATSDADATQNDSFTEADAPLPELTPELIQFKWVNDMPSGDYLYYNDWAKNPQTITAMKPDGTDRKTIMGNKANLGIYRRKDKALVYFFW